MVSREEHRARRRWLRVLLATALFLAACGRSAYSNAGSSPTSSSALAAKATMTSGVPASCPVTLPSQLAFVPPAPYSQLLQGRFWYGTPALWTALEPGGVWIGLPATTSGGYGQKVFWWSRGYDWAADPQSPLTVTGRRIDRSAPPLVATKATNAFAPDIGSAMLVGVDVPAAGCWEIIGHLKGAALSFVVWIPS